MTIFTRRVALATMGALLATSSLSYAAEDAAEPRIIEVQMLNKHPEDGSQKMVFHPALIHARVGDTIKFIAGDKSHNASSNKKMIPEGAEGFKGKINKDVEYTVTTAGFYGIECTPHATAGMVALLIVEGEGKLANLDAAREVKHRGKSKGRYEDLWAEAEEKGLLEEVAEVADAS